MGNFPAKVLLLMSLLSKKTIDLKMKIDYLDCELNCCEL